MLTKSDYIVVFVYITATQYEKQNVVKKMTTDEPLDDPTLRGWRRHFNNYTVRGRANHAKLWLSVYAGLFLLYRATRDPAEKIPEKK